MITQSPDTSPEAERVLIELLRAAPPWRKWEMMEDMRQTVKALVLVGLHQRHPGASPEEIQRRLAGLILGEELASDVYGPLPARPSGTR